MNGFVAAAGATRMVVLMVSEHKHSSWGNWGTEAQQADWGTAAKSNLFDKSGC